MSQLQPAIALLENEAEGLRARISALDAEVGELRARLSGLAAAAAVLRGSAAIARIKPPKALPAPEPADPPCASTPDAGQIEQLCDRVLAGVEELGAHAFAVNLAIHLGMPRDDLREVLARLEREGRVRVVPLGPMQGLVERLDDRPTTPPEESAAPEASDPKAERLLAAIVEFGPTAGNEQLRDRLGWDRNTVIRHLARLEASGRIRRTGSTRGRRIELVGAPAGGEVDGYVDFSALDRGAENEHATTPAAAPAELIEPEPVPEPEPEPEPEPQIGTPEPEPALPPPVAPKVTAPAAPKPPPRRRVIDPAPASRSASARPVVPRPAAAVQSLVSKHRKAVAADEAEAIARHMATKGAPKYEAGTMLALLERTFVGAGKTFEYHAGLKAARAPYAVNGRSLTSAKAIEAANEIRRKAGLEPIAVPGKPAKRGRR